MTEKFDNQEGGNHSAGSHAFQGLDLVSLSGREARQASGSGRDIQNAGERQMASAADDMRSLEAQNHLRDIQVLAGPAPKNPVARDSEQLLLKAGASFAPTPNNLGSEGCMAAISTNVLKPLSDKYNLNIPYFQDSHAFVKYVQEHPNLAEIYKVKIDSLSNDDLKPGDIVVGNKSDGNHVMGWGRVPANWGWNSGDLLAIGNTGLKEFGKPAMRLAQEYIGPKDRQGDEEHNQHHGMINSRSANNPYRVGSGTQFTIIRFKNPDGTPSLDGPPPHSQR